MSRTATVASGDFPTVRAGDGLRILHVLKAPWYATKRSSLWLSLTAFFVCGVIALASGITMPTHDGQMVAMAWYTAGAVFLWAFGLSGLVLLARDARAMALPGVLRNTTLSACVYAALTIAIPTIIEGAFGWNASLAALIAALAVASGLCFVMLPRWISAWMGFLPAIFITAHQTLHLTVHFDAGFLRWGTLLLVALLAAVALQWRRILRDARSDNSGWGTPMILRLRQQAVSGSWSFDKHLFCQRGARKDRDVDLRGIDAHTPAKAIEVALGTFYVPRTTAGKLRRLAAVTWPVFAFAGAMLLVNLGHVHAWRKLLAITAISGAMWGGMFGTTMILFALYTMLKRRWTQGTEPALLALLPGLGGHAPIHRSVLRAMFAKPFGVCAALWAVMIACEVLLRLDVIALALTTLAVFGMCATAALFLLRAFAGRPVRNAAQIAVSCSAFVLMCVTLPLAFATPLAKLGPTAVLVEWLLLAAWLVFGACTAVPALRARAVFMRRAHPFLAGSA